MQCNGKWIQEVALSIYGLFICSLHNTLWFLSIQCMYMMLSVQFGYSPAHHGDWIFHRATSFLYLLVWLANSYFQRIISEHFTKILLEKQQIQGALRPRPTLTPHFWGPRLYSEAQITPFYTQITQKFSKKFFLTLHGILLKFSIDIFWLKNFQKKNVQASHLHINLGMLFKYISHFTNNLNYCKLIKRSLLLDLHCEFHFPVYFMHTEYNSG